MRVLINPAADRLRSYGDDERRVLDRVEAANAYREISTWPGYAPTPLRSLPTLARRLGVAAVFYKDEASRFGLQSFKALGGSYGVLCVLREEVRRAAGVDATTGVDLRGPRYRSITRGVVVTTATDGNHGRSVAWGARLFGCRAVIVLPKGVSAGRERAIRELGADIVRTDLDYDGAVRYCAEEATANGWSVVSDTSYDGYETIPRCVMHGYTVLAAEILQQVAPDEWPTHLFLQAGVGGLAAAVVAYLWEAYPHRRPITVVVEPDKADCLYQTAIAGKLTRASGDLDTIMAGLSCGWASPLAWRILRAGADAFMTIPDGLAVHAMRLLAGGSSSEPAIVAGESAVAGVAGAREVANDRQLRDGLGFDSHARVLFVGTEGATDTEIYQKLVGSND